MVLGTPAGNRASSSGSLVCRTHRLVADPIVIVVAYALALSILDCLRLLSVQPHSGVLTLRGRSKTYEVETLARWGRYLTAARTSSSVRSARAIWFILIGFWFGAIGWRWRTVAVCADSSRCRSGSRCFNRVGAVMTLLRY